MVFEFGVEHVNGYIIIPYLMDAELSISAVVDYQSTTNTPTYQYCIFKTKDELVKASDHSVCDKHLKTNKYTFTILCLEIYYIKNKIHQWSLNLL